MDEPFKCNLCGLAYALWETCDDVPALRGREPDSTAMMNVTEELMMKGISVNNEDGYPAQCRSCWMELYEKHAG